VFHYGLPSVTPSLWSGLVSGYMFIAGVAGSAQVITTAADLVGDRALSPIAGPLGRVAKNARLARAKPATVAKPEARLGPTRSAGRLRARGRL
jgi:hypothetical protein